ncbi:cold-shock protein [Rubrobacter aplysinae]|uniref:cold-shock protein n=1 Tax=Rubrobacter aplysinae TaxID=909625 RepID=UPI00069F45B7|nr:cold shock domain-containing protein [Rubrobacter aplysinae]
MADSKKRIALKPHMKQIREWVDAGKTDDWIADALGTSASSVQSFRSRNDIYRRERGSREGLPGNVFEGVLDHGDRDGYGLWLDPSISEDPVWQEYWAGVESVLVKISEDSIVLEIDNDSTPEAASGGNGEGISLASLLGSAGMGESTGGAGSDGGQTDPAGENGRIKWFDPDKGYGFIIRPTGEDLFFHHSEVKGDSSALEPGSKVGYEVGENDRGPNARRVRQTE